MGLLKVFLQQSLLHREYWISLILMGLIPILIPMLGWVSIFEYAQVSELGDRTARQFVQYYLLSFIIFALGSTDFHYEFSKLIQTGQLNFWLLRPLKFFPFSLAISAGRTAPLFLLGIILFFCSLIIWPQIIWELVTQQGLIIICIALAVCILALINICIGLVSFWLIHTEGTFAAIFLVLQFFGGLILPLDLLPLWLQRISFFLPMRFVYYMPVELTLNEQGLNYIYVIAGQVIWVLLLLFAAHQIWRHGLKHYDAIGG